MSWTATLAPLKCSAALALLVGLLLAPAAGRAQAVPAGQGLVADETELQVLRELYAATNGPSWGNHTNWLQGTTLADAATWAGVGVSNGDVINLNLSYNQLSGPLPPRLGELRALQYLDLRNNQLTGPIPVSLGQCTRLQWLVLERNQLSGSVPAELGNATGLMGIVLGWNNLTGELPAALSQLHLIHFWVDYNNLLTGVFPAWLLQQTQLEGLGLAGNHFSGPLPAGLGQLGNLRQLYLQENAFTGEVPPELGQLRNLTDLALSANRLTGVVPASLAQLPQMMWLYLSENEFTDLPSWVGNAPGLQEFYVANNRFGFDGLERNFTASGAPVANDYNYAPQHPDPAPEAAVRQVAGSAAALDGALAGAHNRYQWQRWQAAAGQWADLAGQTQPALRWAALPGAAAGRYRAAVTNDWAVNLTLYSRTYALAVDPAPVGCPPPLALTVTPARATLAAGDAVALHVSGARAGSALTFDGVDDQVLLPSPAESATSLSATLTNTFTVEAWVNPAADHEIDPQDNTGTGGTSGQRYVLFPAYSAGGFDGNPDHAGMGISVGRNGVSVYEHTGNYMPATLVWVGPVTGWTHLAVVYENRQPRLYVNGVLVQTGVASAKPYVHPSYEVGGGVYGFYSGGVDEFRVWRTARTAEQIAAAYQTALRGDEADLAGCWPFDEGRGLDAFDATAAQRGGLLTRGAHWNGQWSPFALLPPPTPESAQWQVPSTAPPLSPVFRWSPAAGLDRSEGPTVSAQPVATTTYTVSAVAANGCPPSQATVTVTVAPPPPLQNPPVDGCTPTLADARPADAPLTGDLNYVRTYVPRTALTQAADLPGAPKEQVQVKTDYSDGLGRPVQTVAHQQSPLGHDVVQPVAYDGLGRQAKDYLPFVATAGAAPAGFYPQALQQQYDFYRDTQTPGPGNAFDGVARTGVAYSENQFEASPLNRVLQLGAPGEAWALGGGHAAGRAERPNTDADAIARFAAAYYGTSAAAAHALTYQGPYAAGALWVTQTTDEDGHATQEFKDQQGQVVAKKVGLGTGQWLTTAYVYDDFNCLRAVLPPKATALLAGNGWQVTAAVDALLFYYRYDGRGRQLAKQVPGQTGEAVTVYDQLDRPALGQDPAQRARQEWSWTKYDALGRVVLTGLVTRDALADALQQEADQLGTAPDGQTPAVAQFEQPTTDAATQYYSVTGSYPRLGQDGFGTGQVLTATYYDDYNFDHDAAGTADLAFDNQYTAQFPAGQAPTADGRVMGMATRTQARVLGMAETDPGAWLTSTTFYDDQARPVQVVATNARGGQDVVTSQLDFVGQVLKIYSVHPGYVVPARDPARPNHEVIAVIETHAYDHAGRLLATYQQLPGEAVPALVASLAYNEVGQVVQKTLAPGTGLEQRVDYAYNIRGWLTGLNEDLVTGVVPAATSPDLWGMQLSYDCGFRSQFYNSNVSGQKWRGKHDGVARAYGYGYDGANRLLYGDFVAQNAAGSWTAEQQRYGLAGVRYDENGNILALQRRGLLATATPTTPQRFGPVDDLAYAYAGNRLQAVNDGVTGNELPRPAGYAGAPTSLAGDFQEQGVQQAQEYAYDDNGSLVSDANKGITGIAYNHLNLPTQVNFSAQDYLEFRYAANGQKVAKLVHRAGQPVQRTDYLGPYQYEGDSLRFFPHAEGRVLRFVSYDPANQPTVRYEREYTLKDHLGNLRLAYRAGHRLTYTATLNLDDADTHKRETQQFDAPSVSAPVAQQVGAGVALSDAYVAKLNAGGNAPQPLGPLKQLVVQKGDVVTVTAPGYYPKPVQSAGFAFSMAAFVAALLQQQPAPAPGADGQRRTALPLLSIGVSAALPALTQLSGGVPQGYVRLLVFDANSNLVVSQTVTQQLSAAAASGYEPLHVQVKLAQDGYVTAYVGNESNADVYFDNVQVVLDQGLQVQENSYDPWGGGLAGLDYVSPGLKGLNQYQYNGKEQQNDLGLKMIDYGARLYDATLGRWHTIDAKAELYFNWNPYTYALNTPTNAIDPDGHLVIFVAGQNTGDGNTSEYWRQAGHSFASFSGDLSKPARPSDWSIHVGTLAFDQMVIDHFNDSSKPLYLDGALGGWTGSTLPQNGWNGSLGGLLYSNNLNGPNNLKLEDRYAAGYQAGKNSAASIIKSLKHSGGVITESIKVIAHSMGAGYAKGLIQAFVDYAKNNPAAANGLSITEYDFAAFQQNEQHAIKGVSLFQYDNDGDWVVGGAGYLFGSHHQPEDGAEPGANPNANPYGGHSIFDFTSVISSLPVGKYKFQDGKIVPY